MFLEGRPPVNVGVTSNGDVFGGTEISFGDVLGDKQFNIFARRSPSTARCRFSYVNLSTAVPVRAAGLIRRRSSSTAASKGCSTIRRWRRSSAATRRRRPARCAAARVRHLSVDRFRRLELSAALVNLNEHYNDPALQDVFGAYQRQDFGQQVSATARCVPFSVAFVQETTVFREFGPLAGSTMRLAYDVSPKIGPPAVRQTFDGDARYYLRLATHRRAGDARARLQEHRRLARLHLFRRQL